MSADQNNSAAEIDAISLGVMWDRLIAISDEIMLSIVRTAFSVGVREAWDLASVLFDREGRCIAQATLSMPAFIGTAPLTMQHMLRRFPLSALEPGDILVTNDPWLGTGHTPDICVARPVFFRGRIVAFVMTITHLPDIGGAGLAISNKEVYEEGLILPVCKLYRRGEPDPVLRELIEINVRTPDQVFGDIAANVNGTAVGERRIAEFMQENGLHDLQCLADGIIRQSEQSIRTQIRAIPDGVYHNKVEVETVENTVLLCCAANVSGDSVQIDFTGTGAAVAAAINVPLCYTYSFSTYVVKCLTTPRIPNNQGSVRPVSISAPEGCILNAIKPAPVGGRHTVGWFIVPLITGAFAEAMPDRVQAEAGMASLFLVDAVRPDGRALSTQYFLAGGLGAMQGLDGHQTTPSPTNNAVVPSEVWEAETGMRVLHRRLLPDSGGAGEYRGGVGQEAVLKNTSAHTVSVSLFGLRTEFPARGYAGGGAGRARQFLINDKAIRSKGRYLLAPGDILSVREAGGGGYGDPRKRDPQAALQDVMDGFISPQGALAQYGVSVDLSAGVAWRNGSMPR